MIPKQVSQQQRDAIKTAANARRLQATLARKVGIKAPTLNIWLATGRGLRESTVEAVLAAAASLLGISIDRMADCEKVASTFHPKD